MQGKPVQEAKLLKSDAFTRSTDKYALTQAELQSLTVGLAYVLTHEQEVLQNLKHRIDNCWRKSEPDNADTEVHFTRMNELRNHQRKIKKDHAKLSVIQYKLKRQQGK
jgi:reverse gyrase